MEDERTMGAGCGQKSADASPAEPVPEVVEIYVRPGGITPQATTVEDANEDEEYSSSPEVDITSPPAAMPCPIPGMSLPAWLKLVIKADEGSAIDQLALLEAYHLLFPQPHIPNETLTHILRKIFIGAVEADELKKAGNKLWLIHLRWLNAAEAAVAFEAGHEAAKREVVSSETRKNAARVMDFLLTVGDGKLLVKQRASGEGVEVDAIKPSAALPETSMPPPPPPLPPIDQPIQPIAGLQAPRPKRDLARLFRTIKEAPSFNKVTHWLREVLISDAESEVDTFDITHAYNATHVGDAVKPHIDAMLMGEVVMQVFGNEDKRSLEEYLCQNDELPTIAGAHKLLHIPDPERTKLWLKTVFVADPAASTSMPTIWDTYERIFWRWADTHAYLEIDDLITTIRRTFRKCTRVEVSTGYHVIHGIRLSDTPLPTKKILARKQKQDLHRLQRAGEIDPPKTLFAQKLLEDPLLMRPRRTKGGAPIAGSYAERTRRRGGGPEGERGMRQPLGDEEPGFPGLSLKRRQAAYKRELEEYDKKVEEMQHQVDREAGLPYPDPNRVPRKPGDGIYYV